MNDEIRRDALIHDLSIVLAGSLHPSAKIGPAPRLAARRIQDVLGIADGETARIIEAHIREAFGIGAATKVSRPADGEVMGVKCPYCGAQPGEYCKDYVGGTALKLHAKRIKAAMPLESVTTREVAARHAACTGHGWDGHASGNREPA